MAIGAFQLPGHRRLSHVQKIAHEKSSQTAVIASMLEPRLMVSVIHFRDGLGPA